MNDHGSVARHRALRVVLTVFVAVALAIMGLPAAGASAATGDTQGTAILKIGSQITVTPSANPVSPSSNLTLTATFAVIAGNSDVSPTGEVTFLDDGTPLGTGTLSGQNASWTGQLPLGTHPITASYNGDDNYTPAVSHPLSLQVAYIPQLSISLTGGTTLTNDGSWSPDIYIAANSDPAAADVPHTRFRVDLDYSSIAGMAPGQLLLKADGAVVSSSSEANGHVIFDVGPDADLGPGHSTGVTLQMKAASAALPGAVTMSVTLLSSPDGQVWAPSTSAASQDFTVQQNSTPTPTTTTVSASNVVTDASTAPVQLTATVTPDPGDGIVTFLDNGTAVDAADISAGTDGTVTVSPSLGLGYHTISATYAGNAHFATSTGLKQQQVTVTPPGGNLHAITPVRLLDTRNGTGAPRAKIAAGAWVDLQVTGQGGIPATGVQAVSVNVTVVQPTGSGYMTLYPSDRAVPGTANIDFPSIVNTSGLVMTAVSAAGKVRILNKSSGFVSLIADVSAYFTQPTGSLNLQGRYNAVAPMRLADTRKTGILKPGQTLSVQVAGLDGIPAIGVGAVVLNVTTVNPTSPAWLALYPSGGVLPHVSTNAFQKAETRAGRVIVGLGSDGKVNVYNSPYASTNVVVDVCGWFTSGSSAAGGSTFVPMRDSVRMTSGQTGGASWGSLESRSVGIAGVAGIPRVSDPMPPSAVVSNLHVTAPSLGGYLAAYPAEPRPAGSDLNFVKGQAVQNLSIAKLNGSGAFKLFHTEGTANITIDLYGWFA